MSTHTTTWFRKVSKTNRVAKMHQLAKILKSRGIADVTRDIMQLRDPNTVKVSALLRKLSALTPEDIYALVGDRPEGSPLVGVEIAITPYTRVILNRFAAAQECPVHDHGGLTGEVFVYDRMFIQRYERCGDHVDRMFGPHAQGYVPAMSVGSLAERNELHSFRPTLKAGSPDTCDIAIYYEKDGEPLRELQPWDAGSCLTCMNQNCRIKQMS